jgi:hypothetical protein
MQIGLQVQRHGLVPARLAHLHQGLEHGLGADAADDVHQGVDAAERVQPKLRQRAGLVARDRVAALRHQPRLALEQLAEHRLRLRQARAGDVADDQRGALLGEARRHRPSHRTGRAGDQRHFSLQSHRTPS